MKGVPEDLTPIELNLLRWIHTIGRNEELFCYALIHATNWIEKNTDFVIPDKTTCVYNYFLGLGIEQFKNMRSARDKELEGNYMGN